MSPTPPPIRPSFEDKISPETTLIPDDVVIREGKKYKVEKQVIQHGTTWKVWQGTQAIFLAIFSLGIGLAIQGWRDAIKNKWHQAITGEETKRLKRFPPDIQTTTKTSDLGAALQPIKESPKEIPIDERVPTNEFIGDFDNDLFDQGNVDIEGLEAEKLEPHRETLTEIPMKVRNLLDEARVDLLDLKHKLTIVGLEKGLEEALNVSASITNPDDKTTIFAISELVAQHFVSTKEFDKATELRIRTALATSPAPPLSKLSDALKNEDPKLGLRLQPVDTSLFKNQTVTVQNRKYSDGTAHLHLDAKISHPARNELQPTLDWIVANPKNLLNALPKGFCTDVSITNELVSYEGRQDEMGKKWAGAFSADIGKSGYEMLGYQDKVINFQGIGKVKIGNDFGCRTAYNRISIDLDPNISEEEAAAKLNIIFATLGLGAVSSSPRDEDIERIKIMQLFRAYYPQQAYVYEREQSTFQMSLEALKINIVGTCHQMEDKFKEFLVDHPERMYQQEVYPGQYIWAIDGLAREVRAAGGLGLMHGVFGNDFDDTIGRLINMLKTGILATQDRFQAGIIAEGASCYDDLSSGGAESVFARLVTENMSKNPTDYPLNGNMQILCDLDLVERVGFVYSADDYGTKEESSYSNRPSLLQLVENCQINPGDFTSNEVCIRNHIPPERFKGVLVLNQWRKTEVIKALKLEGLITLDNLKGECINGVPVDQFIHVGEFKAEYWA